jgi:hypothetical protein
VIHPDNSSGAGNIYKAPTAHVICELVYEDIAPPEH